MDINQILSLFSWIETVAGGVWVILSLVMIWLLIRIYQLGLKRSGLFKLGIFLFVFVWVYPLYTGFFSWLIVGIIGNVLTGIVTILYWLQLKKKKVSIANWMIPQVIWLSIASVYSILLLVERNAQ